MLYRLIFISVVMLPAYAFAQDATITLPTSDVAHVVGYLNNGGSYLEAKALADQITKAAQADLAKQQAAAKAAQAPATPPAAPESK